MVTFPDIPSQSSGTFPECINLMAQGLQQTLAAVEAMEEMLASELPQSVVLVTNGSGQVTWVYPAAYVVPPCIQNAVLANSGNAYQIREISRTNTQVVLQVLNAAVISLAPLIAVSVSGAFANVGAGISVSITAQKATA